MARVDLIISTSRADHYSGAGTVYPVRTVGGVLYQVLMDSTSDIAFRKSTDNGLTWSLPIVIYTGTAIALAVWYDRDSNIAAGLIHIAYIESVNSDTLYRSIDTESSDALSTETTIFAGTSAAAGGALSIARARGGNLYCATMIDAGAEGVFARSVDVGANWTARATVWEAVTQDQIILVPGWAADNQDMMAFFWDASADEISRKLYDDSADSWAEASIATSMVDTAATTTYPHFAAAVDIANTKNLLVAWTAKDLANADMRYWGITESAITEGTNVVLNSTDDQGMCAIGIETVTGHRYAFYCGKSDGSETFSTILKIYYKVSTDDGATWGAETLLTAGEARGMNWLACTPRFATEFGVGFYGLNGVPGYLQFNAPVPRSARAQYVMGM